MSDDYHQRRTGYNVDHEVIVQLNRFKVDQSLVVNMIGRERCGLAGWLVTKRVHVLVSRPGGINDGAHRADQWNTCGEDAGHIRDHLGLRGIAPRVARHGESKKISAYAAPDVFQTQA